MKNVDKKLKSKALAALSGELDVLHLKINIYTPEVLCAISI